MSGESIRIRWAGGERTAAPGAVVTIGREPGSTIELSHERASRRHGELRSADGSWTYTDVGSSGGTWLNGSRVQHLPIAGTVSLRMGAADAEAVDIEVIASNAGPAPTQVVGPAVLEPTVVPNAPPPPPSRPGGALAPGAASGATEVVGDTLNVQFADRNVTVHPGQQVILGRETDADLPTNNPTVSRHHARLSFQDGAWWLEDLSSRQGTFLDGRKVSRERLQGSMAFWLGAVDAGERLVVVASGETRQTMARRMSNTRTVALVAGIAGVIAMVAVLVVVLKSGDDGNSKKNVEADLRRSAVLLQASYGSGTGSVIDAELGLILTNAHVAAPTAFGLGVNYPTEAFTMPTPDDEILISIAEESDQPAEPAFYGRVVVADGYLDLAIVKITKTIGGRIVEPGDDLGLTEIPIGDSRSIDQDSDLIVMGYPGVAETRSPTKSEGAVSSFIPDERLNDNRAWMNSDAEIVGGNSGGIAADENGRLIAVPTAELGSGTDSISKLRPVHHAEALIEAAKNGTDYVSPYVTPATTERIDGEVFFATDGAPGFSTDCTGRDADGLSSANAISVTFDYADFPEGHQDVMATVLINDEFANYVSTADDWPFEWGGSGCAAVTIPLGTNIQQGDKVTVWLDAGPNYERELANVSFDA